ncbi:B12-binding domain-containing radical SAM protein [candidate division LCP-89 bacterium B3_LCP]|uniref:B12-binding domain-containing radical SAM protein n=1 Tax=candidate division LCP-89 bacterium B3_LCP TaxID=2012998 RepID=A0A532UXU2_UNCL8|nr:MAG: B12-binding domain-containing radical SAM protein [candidate division LCP-89 bacterium B3_LCP]
MDRLKVLMLNPPFLKRYSRPQRNPGVTRSDTMYYPYWMAYATGALEQAGLSARFFDAPAAGWDYPEIERKALDFKPDLLVLDTSTPSIYNDVDVLNALKGKLPDAKTLMLGTHATAMTDETFGFSENIDFIVRGEYDYTLRELALALENGEDVSNIQGVSYRDNGEIKHNQPRELIENLDEIPFVSEVYKRHLNIWDYFNPDCLYPNVTILTGRGCPYRCTFCLWTATLSGYKTRFRAVDSVLDELMYIQKEFPDARAVFFEDDIFTINEKRCQELCEGMIKRGFKMKWNANSRADISLETMKVMKKAGCRALCIGFETGNQDVLDAYGKRIKVEDFYTFSENAHKVGIHFHGAFIVGGPGENREKMENTLRLAYKIKPDTAQFYPLMVYPGTVEYERMKENGMLVTEDYKDYLTADGLHNCIIRTEDLAPEELVRWCDYARRKFYLRFSFIWYKFVQGLFDVDERKRTRKAFKVFMKHLYRPSV